MSTASWGLSAHAQRTPEGPASQRGCLKEHWPKRQKAWVQIHLQPSRPHLQGLFLKEPEPTSSHQQARTAGPDTQATAADYCQAAGMRQRKGRGQRGPELVRAETPALTPGPTTPGFSGHPVPSNCTESQGAALGDCQMLLAWERMAALSHDYAHPGSHRGPASTPPTPVSIHLPASPRWQRRRSPPRSGCPRRLPADAASPQSGAA